ncbi:MAG: hypothetical protein IJY39_08020 [Clostridia bacterium]|nr:hypothetical protein [Clostridia bacterium]
MQIVHIRPRRELAEEVPLSVLSALPYRLVDEIGRAWEGGAIEEIRLRRGRQASITLPTGNRMLATVLDGAEIEAVLTQMCSGSLYAYTDTIKQGYVSLSDGVRVGVAGRAASEGERVIGVHEITSLAIRLPHRTRRVGEPICDLIRRFDLTRGVLIYAPPGVGKTTLLRGVIAVLSSGKNPLRTAVIDTRGELSFSADGAKSCLDVLSGYPRRLGIEIATRTLSAQVIVCDEIGDYEEAMALVSSHNCGVPLIASAHASGVGELLSRTGIRLLHEARIFGAYVGIKRSGNMDFAYDVCLWEDAEGKKGEL